MKISQETMAACLDIARGRSTSEKLDRVKKDIANIFGEAASLQYCRVLLSANLMTLVPNLKDVKPENVDTWYIAKNTLIRYLARYPTKASKMCPVYLAMIKARDSVNLI